MTAAAPPLGFARAVLCCFLPFACGYYLSYFYRSLNAVIGPNLVAEIGLDAGGLGLLTAAYFLAFAAFQIPLGLLLDRYGPRRVQSALILSAALGAVVFGLAQTAWALGFGRALIGLGVAGGLMASFKANTLYWPPERLAMANGCVYAFGGLGASSATLPVEWLLGFVDWRVLFFALAAITVAASLYIFLAAPERGGGARGTLGRQAAEVRRVFAAPAFLAVAPIVAASQSAFIVYQTLWAGPWLREVVGLPRAEAATVLFAISIAAIPGAFFSGVAGDVVRRRGGTTLPAALGFIAAFMAVQAWILLADAPPTPVLWSAFGFLGTGSILGYAYLTQESPPELSGRVNTTVNLVVFSTVFAHQWAVGAIVDLFPKGAEGAFPVAGQRAAFAATLGVQVLALLWLAAMRRRAGIGK